MSKWFLKNHDFIHVNSSMAGKYNKQKQDGSHLRFPIRMILATVDLTSHLHISNELESIVLSVQEKKTFKMDAMAAIWDFLSQQFELFFIYKSPRCFLPSFESNGISVQEKKWKTDFQDGCHGGHLGFLTATCSTSHPDTSYQVSSQMAFQFRRRSEK